MGINATLIVQMLVFVAFVLFTMKFVWPPIAKAMEERQTKISEGLAAAEQGTAKLNEAQEQVNQAVREAREQAQEIIAQANARSNEMIEEAKATAQAEGDRMIATAKAEIERDVAQARESLRAEVAGLAVTGAERILGRQVDAAAQNDLLDDLAAKL